MFSFFLIALFAVACSAVTPPKLAKQFTANFTLLAPNVIDLIFSVKSL